MYNIYEQMYMYMYMADKISKKSTTPHFFTFTFTEYKRNLIVIALIKLQSVTED